MLYAVTKALLPGAIIATASEVAKRSSAFGAVILSLPLVSLLAFEREDLRPSMRAVTDKLRKLGLPL